MNVGDVSTSALSGMQRGQEKVQEGAQRVANGDDPVEALQETKEGARQVEASAKVEKAEDDAIGKLIDEYA